VHVDLGRKISAVLSVQFCRNVHYSKIDNFCLRNGLESGTVASVVFIVGTEMYNEAFHLTALH
jgi:hypothetical protein